jgi:hypothetical protein
MTPEIFILDLESAGFTLAAQGENLIVTPADRLTDVHRQFIRAHKPELLRLLAGKVRGTRPDPLNPSGDPELTRLLSMSPGARLVALVQAGYRCEFEGGRLCRVVRPTAATPAPAPLAHPEAGR